MGASMTQVGDVIANRYKIERAVARGGMAEVFVARDQQLDREVAVKVLFPEYAIDPSFVERFRREAQHAAMLNHPNIVGVYDYGRERGTYYIVMEYVEGESLRDVLRERGRLAPMQAARVTAEIAAGLDFAHRHGTVHRDIKPGNVLIDPSGQVKVADFGIAANPADAASGLTATGAVIGTATYFSPEQAQGYQVDGRSDVYSLGVVLYEMLTGRPLFLGTDDEVMEKHVRAKPVPLRERRAEIPQGLEAMVLRCLEKDRDSRYQTAQELASDLRGGELAKQPVATGQKVEGDRGKRKPIAALAVIAVVLLVGLAALSIAVWPWPGGGGDQSTVPAAGDTTPPEQSWPTHAVAESSPASTPGPTLNAWIPVGLQGIPVDDLVLSPDFENDQAIFAASGGNYACGVYKSSDAGHSWTRENSGLTLRQASAIAISPNYVHDQTLLAGTYFGGIFRSLDGGQ
ncbi:MAG TPA: protein kinase, partial [Acidimicrobiia bacterium]|nr:protein kinase [Acidimicrobiia bacterium]